tara:strand:+ start:777 stop:1697 length:921 start_codon:yes stop_codon:yes gene_type:complete
MQEIVLEFIETLRNKKYASNSISSHKQDLRKFFKWLNIEEDNSNNEELLEILTKLSQSDIEEYIISLDKNYKPRTLSRHISSLKIFLNYLEIRGIIKASPAHRLRFPEIIPEAPEILSTEEVISLLEAPPLDHYLGLRDRAMIELLYSSGLKVKELLKLNLEDIFLDLEFVKIKSKRERMVPITSKAIEILRMYIEEGRSQRLLNPADPCLFPSRNGTRMSRIGFWAMIKKHAHRAGITSPINPRILRHSFAVHLLQNGTDLSDIMNLFGYVSLDATLQYAHINRPDFFDIYHKLHPRGQKNIEEK